MNVCRINCFKSFVVCGMVGILIAFAGPSHLRAEERVPSSAKNSRLTVPWDEFKKLIKIDEGQVVLPWDSFQKILSHTEEKDIPTYRFKGGNIVLSQTEFKKLVDAMKPPVRDDEKLPFDYLVTKAVYNGRMSKESTTFDATFTLQVLKKKGYIRVPLLSASLGLKDLNVNGKQAFVKTENGYHYLTISSPGKHIVKATFSMRSSMEKGPHTLTLPVPQTSITLLSLKIPLKDIEVEVPEAQQVRTTWEGNYSLVSAVIAPTTSITVKWSKKDLAVEKLPSKLYTEVYHLVSIEDDVLKVTSDINCNILHSEINQLRLEVPDGINILGVTGNGVGEWREVEKKGKRRLIVPFDYGKKGRIVVTVTTEKAFADEGTLNTFETMRVLDTVREIGFIGFELNTSAEVTLVEETGLEKIPVQKLPPALYNKSAKPLIYGFKYLKHPNSLELDIKKHEKIPVPVAAIDSANTVTLFTGDGKIVTRLVYQVRNNGKQFLELSLPDGADVWSVFVGNEPVESSINKEGRLLVPLIRSRSENNNLNTFPVEIIYCLVDKKFSCAGMKKFLLPSVDIIISQLMWSVYLPNDVVFLYFDTTLEKEEIIEGFNVFGRQQRVYIDVQDQEGKYLPGEEKTASLNAIRENRKRTFKKDKINVSRFKSGRMDMELMREQKKNEMAFSQRLQDITKVGSSAPARIRGSLSGRSGVGVLPIHIKLPTGGQLYRFAKTIIKQEDPLVVKVVFLQSWVVKIIKWLIGILLVLFLYRNRKKIQKKFGPSVTKIQGMLKKIFTKYEEEIKSIPQSKALPFMLLTLSIASALISFRLAAVFFFLFLTSTAYIIFTWIINRVKKKKDDEK